jgi:GNAT superfamily N-acetyltransferase
MTDHRAPDPTGVTVRRLTHDDVEDALALSSAAGWNQRADDWRILIDVSAGSFAALSANRIVGTAVGIDYGRFSWIAMMLVDSAHRGRGLGRRLLEAALDAVPADRPVRLDATPLGRPLYEAYGFDEETTITRYVADPARRASPAPDRVNAGATREAPLVTRPLTGADLPLVAEQDHEVFGGDRRTVLAWALDVAPAYAHAVEPPGASARMQYCLGRKGRLFDQIGPVVAEGDDVARMLVSASLGAARGRGLAMDVFDQRAGFAAWLRTCGFTAQRPLFRMRRTPRSAGTQSRAEDPAHERTRDTHFQELREFTILGPEFA